MGRRTVTVARVRLWGTTIGAVSWNDDRDSAHFEYDPAFIAGGRQVAPLTTPLANEIYSFPALPRQTFHGLPGLLADSLPRPLRQCAHRCMARQTGTRPGRLQRRRTPLLCRTARHGRARVPPPPKVRRAGLRPSTSRRSSSSPATSSPGVRLLKAPLRRLAGSRHCRTSCGSAPRRAAPERRRSSPGIPRPMKFAPDRSRPATAFPIGCSSSTAWPATGTGSWKIPKATG